MADITFVVHRDWLDCIKDLPLDQQDKIIADFVRYGTEIEMVHKDDSYTQAFVNILKGRIDFSKEKYKTKVNSGSTPKKTKKVNDEAILDLARQGKKSAEIAKILDISKSSVDHSPGWINRNDDEFVF